MNHILFGYPGFPIFTVTEPNEIIDVEYEDISDQCLTEQENPEVAQKPHQEPTHIKLISDAENAYAEPE